MNAHTQITRHDSRVTLEVKAKVKALINSVVATDESGLWFFRSDTGTAKTQGFIEAITNSNHGVAIAVPTKADVDNILAEFESRGDHRAFAWHTDSGTLKSDAKHYPIIIGTHKWLLGDHSPIGHIGKDRLLIVDEVPTDTTADSLKENDFTEARVIAQYYNLNCLGRFVELEKWVVDQAKKTEAKPSFERLVHKSKTFDAEKEIMECVREETHKHKLRKVIKFLNAASDGRAYKRKAITSSNGGSSIHFAWFEFSNSWFDKSIVFSATSHLDGFQFHRDSDRLKDVDGVLVDYSNLKFTEVPWPKGLDKHVKTVVSKPKQLQLTKEHIKSMFDLGTGPTLIVAPKAVVAHVADYFSAEPQEGSSEAFYSPSFNGREVFITNWGRDVGSNDYRDCETVILWSNQYKPKHTTFSELLVTTEERVDANNLAEVKGGRFTGRPKSLEQDRFYAAIKQMGCRGTARYVGNDGVCGHMNLIMSWADLKPTQLKGIFPKHQYQKHEPQGEQLKPKVTKNQTVSDKALAILNDHYKDKDVVTLQEVCSYFKRANQSSKKFMQAQELFKLHGWEFVPRQSGRAGDGAKFVSLRDTDN